MTAPAVELVELEKRFGATTVVKRLSLSIAPGEFLALLGPSGCGKTTTLRMIAGLERPDGGAVHVAGRLVDDGRTFLPPERRGLGMVFQSYAVWPHKSVFENVAYPLHRQGVRDVEARVLEALDWVRLRAFGDRRPHELSGGQLQRVALARALVGRPAVLLLDEPLSNLDVALREELRGEIAALRSRLGTTMVLVTHDQGEALALADRIAVMNQGRIEQLATPQTLYREPETPFVAGFVGGANLLEGSTDGAVFSHEALRFPLPPGTEATPGRCTLAVRMEDVALDEAGVALPVQARLFLGSTVELRLQAGATVLRVVTSPEHAATPHVRVRFRKVRLYPVVTTRGP